MEIMEIRNADWRAVKDEAGQVSLYEQSAKEPVLVTSVEKFKNLKAIIEQVIRG